eukprot:SAG22_NODE_10402_length_537_cov_0.938356_2_plen_96_part_01
MLHRTSPIILSEARTNDYLVLTILHAASLPADLDRGSYYSQVDYIHKRWEVYYSNDPFAVIHAEYVEAGLLLGGEVDMVSEQTQIFLAAWCSHYLA